MQAESIEAQGLNCWITRIRKGGQAGKQECNRREAQIHKEKTVKCRRTDDVSCRMLIAGKTSEARKV